MVPKKHNSSLAANECVWETNNNWNLGRDLYDETKLNQQIYPSSF